MEREMSTWLTRFIVATLVALAGYAAVDRVAIGGQVTALETRVDGITERLQRIEDKLDRVIERLPGH